MSAGPLAGLRVLDFGQGVAGPYCAQLLGDHGADVIKVEPPRGDWSRTLGKRDAHGNAGTYLAVNRNKRAIVLDFGRPEAVELARALALRADVVVESFRHGVMDRLGLGCDGLRAERPSLVYVSVTGFGHDGPHRDLPAGDSTMQAYGGLMSIVGTTDGEPLRVGNVVSDMVAGTNAFSGTLLALLRRAASGQGGRVDVALLDSIVAFQSPPLMDFLVSGQPPRRVGNEHPLIAPSGAIATADSALVFTVLDHQWTGFCAAMGVPALATDPRFDTMAQRLAHRQALKDTLAALFAGDTTERWLSRLRASDVLCAPIQDYPALVADPQVANNGLVTRIPAADGGTTPTIRTPVRLSDSTEMATRPPALGEHTAQVLKDELQLPDERIQALQACGAIRLAAATGELA